jgi:hypothetical protein
VQRTKVVRCTCGSRKPQDVRPEKPHRACETWVTYDGTNHMNRNMIAAEASSEGEFRRLTTPRAAALAGILFSLLFAGSLVLLRSAIPENLSIGTEWVERGAGRISLAMGLMPFAGIAFLWFIGVVRDRLGEFEDRFFSTVFLGSGLLFLAMVFVSLAIAGGILASSRIAAGQIAQNEIIYFGRAMMLQISNVYALRMAGVLMISLGTIWLRTGLMPRWLAVVTYLVALTLLVVINLSLWVTLIFPAWVLVISMFILLKKMRRTIR